MSSSALDLFLEFGKHQRHDQKTHGRSARSVRAKLSHKPATLAKQKVADRSEADLSRALGLGRTSDNDAFDLKGSKVGVEVKTMVDNKNDKITMHPSSRVRKLREARREKIKPFTVVIDRRGPKPEFYWKKGVGSFRLGSLNKADSMEALREVLPV
jgi:hypothetical protein